MAKEKVIRGSTRRFQTTITDLSGNPQDPDTCFVRLEKAGYYYLYDTPTGWFACKSVGAIGEWGADIWLNNSMTLGDWLARFYWTIAGVPNYASFYFTVIRKDKPWVHTPGPRLRT